MEAHSNGNAARHSARKENDLMTAAAMSALRARPDNQQTTPKSPLLAIRRQFQPSNDLDANCAFFVPVRTARACVDKRYIELISGLVTDHATSNSGTPTAELLWIVRVIVTASMNDDRTIGQIG